MAAMSTGHTIAEIETFSLKFGELLLDGIEPGRFARLPEGKVGLIPTNHPAWVYGHLGLYGTYLCTMVGHEDAAQRCAAPDGWDKLFGHGSPCEDDADGSRYPDRDAILAQLRSSTAVAAEALRDADDAVFEQENPVERMRERFPTVGIATTFLAGSHAMMHYGQVSAWRRIEGLGSAM